jgi:hypothetical protein
VCEKGRYDEDVRSETLYRKTRDERSTFLKIAAISAVFVLAGCATDDGTRLGSEPEFPYATSNAEAASYGADGFTFNKKMNVRAPNEFMFYYKRCTLTGDRSYYSRTDYYCTEP